MTSRRPAPADHLVIRVGPGFCACGCLERVTEGRAFRPGHDARLKGQLGRAGRTLTPVYTENYLWIDEVGNTLTDDEGNQVPIFNYNQQYLNCTWTAYEYGYHVLSERGARALWDAIENPTYRRGGTK
jgi:hypothetical protein